MHRYHIIGRSSLNFVSNFDFLSIGTKKPIEVSQ